jgi:4-aminobutyrate aminotransferase
MTARPIDSPTTSTMCSRSRGDVAAVIAEPVRWTTVEPPPPGFWPSVRASCERHGTLLIFDEIPSALGRCGAWFAHERFGCVPDMVVIGKGLGGGIVPQAALIVRRDLDVVPHAALGHYTHEKCTIGSAAAVATLDVVERERLLERGRALESRGLARLRAMQARFAAIRDVRAAGAYFGLELAHPESNSEGHLAEGLLYQALADGLSFKIGAGNVVTLCPPLTIADADFDQALSILDSSLSKICQTPQSSRP